MRLKSSNGSTATHDNGATVKRGHRLKSARLREGVNLRSVARRMHVPVSKAREQEEGRCDLSVSDLHRWQRALKVPMEELLLPPSTTLSEPIRQRACLIRVAKTAKTLVKKCSPGEDRQLARRVVDLLEELMPELKDVGTLPEARPRPLHEVGRAGEEILTRDWHMEALD